MKIFKITFLLTYLILFSSCNTNDPIEKTQIVLSKISDKENDEILEDIIEENPKMKEYLRYEFGRIYMFLQESGLPKESEIKIRNRFTYPMNQDFKSYFDGNTINEVETVTIVGKSQRFEVVMRFLETKSGLRLNGLYSNKYYGK